MKSNAFVKIFVALMLGISGASAQTDFVWTNTAGGLWNVPASWTNGAAPAAGGSNDYSVIFQNASGVITTNNVGSPNFLLNQLTFNTGAVTIFSGAGTNLVFTNNTVGTLPQINQNTATTIVLNTAITLGTNITFAGTGTGTVTINSNVTGTGTLLMNGPSFMVTLAGSNTYSGGTIISNGTIRVTTSNSLGTTNVTITSGGALDLTGSGTANALNFGSRTFFISGSGSNNSGAIFNNSGATQINALQKVVLTGDASFGGSQRFDIRGGVATLDLAGNTLTRLAGTGYNAVVGGLITAGNININGGTFSIETSTYCTGAVGVITVNSAGVLQFYNTQAGRVTRPITLNGGTINGGATATNDSPIALSANSFMNTPANLVLNGPLTETNGAFGFTKLGAATLILTNSNTYTGGTFVNAGNIQFNTLAAVPITGFITISNGAALNATGAYAPDAWLASGRIATNSAGVLALTAYNSAALDFATPGYTLLALGAVGTVTNSGLITPANNIYRLGGGGGTLILTNANALTDVAVRSVVIGGKVTLTAANNYTGSTLIQTGGVLALSNADALGSGVSAVTINSGGQLQISGNLTITNSLVLTGEGTTPTAFDGALRSVSGNNVWTGPISLGTNANRIYLAAGTLVVSGGITGGAGQGLTLNPTAGTLTITNNPLLLAPAASIFFHGAGTNLLLVGGNTFGTAEVGYGNTLRLGLDNALPTNITLRVGAATSGFAGTLDLNGFNQTVTQLTSASTNGNFVTLTNTTATLVTFTNKQTTTSTYGGRIGGPIVFVMDGPGTLILTNANPNTHTGGTLLTNRAFLVMATTNAIGTGGLTVAPDTGLGTTAPLDQNFLTWITTTVTGTPQVVLLGANSSSNLVFSSSLANTFLGAAGGTFAYNGVATWDDNVLRLGGGSSALLYVPTINSSTNLLVGPIGGNAASTVILTNPANNPASTVIQSGTLQLGNNGAASSVIGANSITISNSATLAFRFNSGTVISTNLITGDGLVAQAGTTPVFIVNANTYTGGTVIAAAGRIGVGDDAALGTGPITVTAAGFLSATGTVARTLANNLIVSNAFTLGNATDTGTLTFNGTVNLTGTNRQLSTSSPITMNGVVFNGGLNKAGSSTLVLTATNTYALGTTLSSGTLSIGDYVNLPAPGPVTFTGGTLQVTGTIVTNLDPYSVNWGSFTGGLDVATAANTLTVTNNISGAGALTKFGAGALILTGSNTYTGATTVNGGTLTLTANNTGNTSVIVAGLATGTAVLNIQPNSLLFVAGTSGSLFLGNLIGATGAVYQTGGTLNYGNQLIIGNTGYGYYDLTSGIITQRSGGGAPRLRVGSQPGAIGLLYQRGGDISALYNAFEVANSATGGSTPTGIVYLTGGTLTGPSMTLAGQNGRGELTVAGTALLTINGNSTIGGSTAYGLLNLNGGTFLAGGNITGGTGTDVLNFDGGTLRAKANSTISGLNAAYINDGGAVIDSSNFTVTVSQSLLAPEGNGLTNITVTSGGAGFIGAPYVAISGGGGSNATAVALIDPVSGAVTNILITNPGTGYTNAPSIALLGGGGSNVVLGAVDIGANISGALTKTGTGLLVLNGSNTFTGGIDFQAGGLIFGTTNSRPANVNTLLVSFGMTAGTGYPLDQDFLNIVSNASAGTVALGGNSGNTLDFTALTNVSLGAANGTWTYNGTIIPVLNTYRLGGGGGTLVIGTNNLITGANDLVAFGSGSGGTLSLRAPQNYNGNTLILGGTVSITNDNQLGTVPASLNPTNIILNGGVLANAVNDTVLDPNRGIAIGSNGGTLNGTVNYLRPQAPIIDLPGQTGAVTFAGNLAFQGNSTNSTFSGGLTILAGSSMLYLNGSTGTPGAPTASPLGIGPVTFLGGNMRVLSAATGPVTLHNNITMAGDLTVPIAGTGFADWSLTFAGALTLSNGNRIINVGALSNSAVVTVSGPIGDSGNNLALTKSGAGILVLTGTNTYTGGTTISAGTLQLGNGGNLGLGNVTNSASLTFRRTDIYDVTNLIVGTGAVRLVGTGTYTPSVSYNLAPTVALVLGETNGPVGNLDLSSSSQRVGSLLVSNHNVTTASTITIGTNQTLTVAGLFQVGAVISNLNPSTTKLIVTGAGALVVSNAGGTTLYGNSFGSNNSGNNTTVDMSSLGTFTLYLGTNGTFKVGNSSGGTGTSGVTATLASNTTVTAGSLAVNVSGNGGTAKLLLGAGTNTINVNNFYVNNGNRGTIAQVYFYTNSGSLYLHAADGVSGANLYVGLTRVNGNATHFMDLTGHSADLNLNLLGVAENNNSGGAAASTQIANFLFDTGTLTATGVRVGYVPSGVTPANVGGVLTGTVVIAGGTVTIGSNGLALAQNLLSGVNSGVVAGVANISGGTVSIGANANTNSVILTESGGGTNRATLNLTGGTVTLTGHITKLGGAGLNTATLTVNGTSLDLTGHNIGNATTPIDFLNFQSGTLANVAEINGGAAVTKTTAGALVLAGINTWTGDTLVQAGALIVNGQLTTSAVTVASVATLGGNGTISQGVTMNGGTLSPGNSVGTLTVGDLMLTNGVKLVFELGPTNASDLVVVNNTLSLGGMDTNWFVLSAVGGFGVGTYTLFDATGITGTLGSETNFANIGGYTGYLWLDDASKDVKLTVVPEPGTGTLVAVGLLTMLLFRRRRQ